MRKFIYFFIIISIAACSKENQVKELPSTTDITCFFNNQNTSLESNKTVRYKSNNYESYYSFSDKITSIIITSKINDNRIDNIINKIIINPKKPSMNDGITLHGLYTGDNTITVEIRSNDRRVCSKFYTPNYLGEIVIKDADIIPVYKKLVKENVFITPNCSIYLGVFKPCNTAAKFFFSKSTDDDTQYGYKFKNKLNKQQIQLREKNGSSCMRTKIELSKEIKKIGVIINEKELSELIIECASRKPGANLYNTIGFKTIKLVAGECLLKSFTEADFKGK